jgi:type IV pilus assembly protein PilA
MLNTLKERLARSHDEDGFTLIELMVVVLIIAILLAIAIPTFLGARNTANARAAQSNLRNALTAEQSYYTNNQSFTNSSTDMATIEPNLGFTSSAVGNQVLPTTFDASGAIGAAGTDTGEPAVMLQSTGKDGNCYAVLQVNETTGSVSAGTYYSASSGNCSAPSAFPATSSFKSTGTAAKALDGNWYPSW